MTNVFRGKKGEGEGMPTWLAVVIIAFLATALLIVAIFPKIREIIRGPG